MLAVIVALCCFEHLLPKARRLLAQIVIRAGADNQALESLSFKQSSTKIPLLFVMMQLGITTARHNIRVNLQWRPRELNTEADALTNSDFTGFDVSKRIHVDWPSLPIELLRSLVAHSSSFASEVNTNRQLANTSRRDTKQHKRRKRANDKTIWG